MGKKRITNEKSDDAETQPRLNWPPFDKFLSRSTCSVNIVHPNQIITIPQLWSSKQCSRYTSFLSTLPLSTTPAKAKKGDAVRVNDRFQVEDAVFAERLWSETNLKNVVLGTSDTNHLHLTEQERRTLWKGDVVGLNPNIRIYRYKKGHFFDKHCAAENLLFLQRDSSGVSETNRVVFCHHLQSIESRPSLCLAVEYQSLTTWKSDIDDESNNVVIAGSPPLHAKTTWTLLLYLTSAKSGCLGGETVFYPEGEGSAASKRKDRGTAAPIVVELDAGMALLHSHGSECLLHEGKEVTEGEKWVIRSDLCVRR